MDTTVWLYVLAGTLIVVGLLGTFLPALPGMPLIFAGMLLAAWVGDFQIIGGWTLAVLGGVLVVTGAVRVAVRARMKGD